jgi:hypothetical protein
MGEHGHISLDLGGPDSTKDDKLAIIEKVKQTWFDIDTMSLRTVRPSQVTAWLSEHYGHKSASYYNSALSVVRAALDMAVAAFQSHCQLHRKRES